MPTDFASEEDQRRLQRARPSATRSVYRGVGHALHWEQPERFAADLRRFVRSLEEETVQGSFSSSVPG